jgi:dimethylargininase
MLALTRPVPTSINACELTHLARDPIDLARAREQHDAYERALRELGCRIERIEPRDDLPDSVFVEDLAVIVDEVAVITRPGAESRRAEVAGVAAALGRYRPLVTIEAPGTLDGGDVLRVGRTVFVGSTARTNEAGIAQLRAALPLYDVRAIRVTGALHLKTAVTNVGDDTLLVNPEWVSPADLAGFDILHVDPGEPFAANTLLVGGTALRGAQFPKTNARLGVPMKVVDLSELAKAEGALTCCSLLVAGS